ncbi:uncharacterized [Tachysurus ichikawai]
MKELVCGNRARKVSKWTSGLAKLDLNTTASKSPHLISTAAAPYHSDDSSLPIMRRCQGSGDRGRKQKATSGNNRCFKHEGNKGGKKNDANDFEVSTLEETLDRGDSRGP